MFKKIICIQFRNYNIASKTLLPTLASNNWIRWPRISKKEQLTETKQMKAISNIYCTIDTIRKSTHFESYLKTYRHPKLLLYLFKLIFFLLSSVLLDHTLVGWIVFSLFWKSFAACDLLKEESDIKILLKFLVNIWWSWLDKYLQATTCSKWSSKSLTTRTSLWNIHKKAI